MHNWPRNSGDYGGGLTFEFLADSLCLWVGGATIHCSSSTITDSNWHYTAGVFDATNQLFQIYIDGNITANVSDSSTPLSSAVFFIGQKGQGGGNFNGLIDEVAVWNRSLSSSEITALYNSQITYYYYNSTTILLRICL